MATEQVQKQIVKVVLKNRTAQLLRPYTVRKECWCLIFDGSYSVSTFGRVRREKTGSKTWPGRILKAQENKQAGYWYVDLCVFGSQRKYLLHKIVIEAFRGPCPPGKEVNHKDGVKKNCRLSNLEYLTKSENQKHALRLGLRTSETGSKLSVSNVIEIKKLLALTVLSHREIAKRYDISKSAVSLISRCKTWRNV